MRKTLLLPLAVLTLLLLCICAVFADLIVDELIADRLEVLEVAPPEQAGGIGVAADVGLDGGLDAAGEAFFHAGIAFLAPLGDVPMGRFNRMPGDPPAPQAPAWWATRGVLDPNAEPNDYAAATQGQVKWIAAQAAAELSHSWVGAGAAVSNLVSGFSLTENDLPVTLGQLKNTAQPFWDRLITVGYADSYPWTGGNPDDLALANVGQVKSLFAFDPGLDSDGDGMPDWWEILHGFNPHDPSDALLDSDGDGLTNLEEFLRGTDPHNPDSDGDGLTDYEEIFIYGTDPLKWDTDSDGLSDGEEILDLRVTSKGRWFDVSGGTNLLDLMGGNLDDGCATVSLPFPITFDGISCSNITVNVNGILWLLTPGKAVPASGYSSAQDLRNNVISPDHTVVAAFWDNLKAYPLELGSKIVMADVTENGQRYCVVEYRDMGFYAHSSGNDLTNNCVSFQVVFPDSPLNEVRVYFRKAMGRGHGQNAAMGVQSVKAARSLTYSYNTLGSVYPGLSLLYRLGYGTDPLKWDTDGDGLGDGEEIFVYGTDPLKWDTDGDGMPDGWEVLYNLNPLDPTDAPLDPDGDGTANVVEYYAGTNPRDPSSVYQFLPGRWTSGTVGQPVPTSGTSFWLDDRFVVAGGGDTASPYEDHFQLCHLNVWGDFELIARVTPAASNTVAGLVLLEGGGTQERKFSTYCTPNTYSYRYRSTKNENDYPFGANTKPFPDTARWHKLIRTGNSVYIYYSEDGVTWGSSFASMSSFPQELRVGLFARSQDTNALAVALFDDVVLRESVSPALQGGAQGGLLASCGSVPGSVVRYTTNGVAPSATSPAFNGELHFAPGTLLMVAAFLGNNQISALETRLIPPVGQANGVCAEYFYGQFSIAQTPSSAPNRICLEPAVSFAPASSAMVGGSGRGDNFIARYTGQLFVPAPGDYVFSLFTEVANAASLSIDGMTVVPTTSSGHDSIYSTSYKGVSASITLSEGLHEIEVRYRKGSESATKLHLDWSGPSFFRRPVTSYDLFCDMRDSDGDGFWDMEESVVYGTDPHDASSSPENIPSQWLRGTTTGQPVTGGGVYYAGGTFMIDSGCTNSDDYSDRNQCVYQEIAGDFALTAKVGPVSDGGYAGLFARESLSPGSLKGEIWLSDSRQHGYRYRSGLNNFDAKPLTAASPSGLLWMRLVRQGSKLLAYRSADGESWECCYSHTIALTNSLKVGLFARSTLSVSSRYSSAQARFGDVALVQRPPVFIDSDGDGLSDFDEVYVYLTDPFNPDTDGDGLTDWEEVEGDHTEIRGDAPWFDVSGGTNLLSSIGGNPDDVCVTASLPFPIYSDGVFRSNITVNVNGILWLLTPGKGVPNSGSSSNSDLTGAVSPDHVVVAAYWDDLVAYPQGLGSKIIMADVTENGQRYCVIEYRDMGFYAHSSGNDLTNNCVSFQVVFQQLMPNKVSVAFQKAKGRGDGRLAALGLQNAGASRRAFYSYNTQGSVYPGLWLTYALGYGTDPLKWDTDGDGLSDWEELFIYGTDPLKWDTDGDGMPDGWEILHGLDPFDPSDAFVDSDGDGLMNIAEFYAGSDPWLPGSSASLLPDRWMSADIGLPRPGPGISLWKDDEFTVIGGGSTVSPNEDHFQLCYRQIWGDFELVSCVSPLTGNTTAGLVLLEGGGTKERKLAIYNTPGSYGYRYRGTQGENDSNSYNNTQTPPCWYKLSRIGSSAYFDYSENGVVWTRYSSRTMSSLPQELRVGLFARSATTNAGAVATFSGTVLRESVSPSLGEGAHGGWVASCGAIPDIDIRYTTDGGGPSADSPLFSGELQFAPGTVVRLAAFAGRVQLGVTGTRLIPPAGLLNGLCARYFYGSFATLPDIPNLRPHQACLEPALPGAIPGGVMVGGSGRCENFAASYTGEIFVPAPGDYVFHLFTETDNAAQLFIDGMIAVPATLSSGNDSVYQTSYKGVSIPITLSEGLHEIEVRYRKRYVGDVKFHLDWEGPWFLRKPVVSGDLFCGMCDSDGDGFSDVEELEVYGTDPGDANSSPGNIPDGWVSETTTGLPIPGGGVYHADGTFIIDSGCSYHFSYADTNCYVFQSVSGDFDICARIDEVSNGGFAGLFARESSAPGARKFELYLDDSNRVGYRYRTQIDASESCSSIQATASSCVWLRLIRQGNELAGYYSYDEGITWKGWDYNYTTPLSEDLKVGLYARSTLSSSSRSSVQARISNVSLEHKGRPPLFLVSSEGLLFTNQTLISCVTPLAGTVVRYETNGVPNAVSSPLMSAPVLVSTSCLLQAVATHPDCSGESRAGIFVSDRHLSGWVASCYPGIYAGAPDFSTLPFPSWVTPVPSVDFNLTAGGVPPGGWQGQVAMRFETSLFVPYARAYAFDLECCGVTQLMIDNHTVLSISALDSTWVKKRVPVNLGIGLHAVEVRYTRLKEMAGLRLSWDSTLPYVMTPVSPSSCFVEDFNQNGLPDAAESWALALLGTDGLSDSNNNGINDLTELVLFGLDPSDAGTVPLPPQQVDPSDLLPGLTVASYAISGWGAPIDFLDGRYPSSVSAYTGKIAFEYSSSFYGLYSTCLSQFGLAFTGYIEIPCDGLYRFDLIAEDEGVLDIDGRRVASVQKTSSTTRSGSGAVALRKGYHAVTLRMLYRTNRKLMLYWASPASGYELVPAAQFFRSASRQAGLASVLDSDGDGIPDHIEIANGTNPYVHNYLNKDPLDPNLADSDVDGVSNYEEAYLALTDPYAADIDGNSILASVSVLGKDGAPLSGFWYQEGTSIFCASRNGMVAYTFNLPVDGCYRFTLFATEHSEFAESYNSVFDLQLCVDGFTNGVCIVGSRYGQISRARLYTQFLKAGQHTVTVDWRNTKIPHSLTILSAMMECLGGVDAGNDGIPDWMSARQNKLVTFKAPPKTFVSPVCIEGAYASELDALTLDGYFVAEDTPDYCPVTKRLPGNTWCADVEVDPEAPSTLTVTHSVSGAAMTNTVEWVPANLFGNREITIRKGDALMFTFQPPLEGPGTATVALDEPSYGAPVPVAFGAPSIYRFTQAGTNCFQVTWTNAAGSEVVSRTLVRVMGGAFSRDPVLALNTSSRWHHTLPPDAWVSCDSNLRLDYCDAQSYYARLATPATAYVSARLGEDGPVLATARVDDLGYASHTQSGYLDYSMTLSDGTEVYEGRISVKNIRPGMEATISFSSPANYFENGSYTMTFTSEDFDENGELRFKMYIAPGSTAYCHSIRIFQNGVEVYSN